MTANTVTTRRFGPSGSLIKANITREVMRAVMALIMSEVVLDMLVAKNFKTLTFHLSGLSKLYYTPDFLPFVANRV